MFEIIANVHFLRPWWFLALLPVAVLLYLAWQSQHKQGAWQQVIEPKFRKLLLGENASTEASVNEKVGYFVLGLLWFMAVLALSGPWIKAVEVPAQKSQQGMVVVLDLSLSMLADDISPNRLARAKYTLTDLLQQYPEYAIGMIGYAGSAHTISPISEDNQTLLSLLPSLNPLLMPSYGAKPIQAFDLAEQLFSGAKITQGHLIWLTDDINENEIELVKQWQKNSGYSMTVLTIGTTQGGVIQIPNYGLLRDNNNKLVMPAVNQQRFQELSKGSNIKWLHLESKSNIIEELLPKPQLVATEDNEQTEKQVQHPMDIGFYLLIFIIPVVALLFRRGLLLNLFVVGIIPMTLFNPSPSYAADVTNSSWSDIFKSADQLGYQAWQRQQYPTAEALFENKQWQASALYRQGQYQQAAELFKLDKSSQGQFNLGNALAINQQLTAAQKAYQQALKLQPDMQQAKDNLETINKLLQQKDQQSKHNKTNNSKNNSDQSPQNQDSAANSKKDSNGQQAESDSQHKPENKDNGSQQAKATEDNKDKGNQQPDSQQNTLADNAKQQTSDNNQQGQATEKLQQQQTADKDDKTDNIQQTTAGLEQDSMQKEKPVNKHQLEQQQAQTNWLNQIPDQPGLFLQRKFEYQYQQSKQHDDSSTQQW